MRFQSESDYLANMKKFFQFSLWDSIVGTNNKVTYNFLSILFMRFPSSSLLLLNRVRPSFNSLYEIQPKLEGAFRIANLSLSILFMRFKGEAFSAWKRSCGVLSILFMRFYYVSSLFWFNTFLLSILFMRFLPVKPASDLPVSILSILFMRFRRSFRLCKFMRWKNFQFSLWDSFWRIEVMKWWGGALSILFMRFAYIWVGEP